MLKILRLIGLRGLHLLRSLIPPCKDFLLSFVSMDTPPVDGIWEDKIGLETRDAVRPMYLVGDGSTYFDFGEPLIPSLSDFEWEIELLEIPTYVAGNVSLLGQYSSGEEGRLSVYLTSSTNLRLSVASELYDSVSINYNYATATYPLALTIKRSNGIFEMLANGISVDTDNKPLISVYQGADLQLLNAISNPIIGKIISIKDIYNNIEFPIQMLMKADGTYSDYIQSSPEGFIAQQYLQPAIPVIEDDTVEGSWFNENGYTVAQALGKNLFNKVTYIDDTFIDPAKGYTLEVASGARVSYIIVKPNTEYYAMPDDRNNIRFEDGVGNFISGLVLSSSGETFTTPSNCYGLYWYYTRNGTDVDSVQLEEGTTATTYEAWTGMYLDEALTTPYADGIRIPSGNGYIEGDS